MNLRKSLIVLLSLLVWTLPETHATGKKILYIGDSVTDGNWGKVSGGPNRSLTDMNHIFGHGYMFICAARYMADYPEEDYRFYNRGISGNRVADLKARWQQDALEIDPDILSVLVGVNDLLDVYNKTDGPQEVDTAGSKRTTETSSTAPGLKIPRYGSSWPSLSSFPLVCGRNIIPIGARSATAWAPS